MKACSWTDAADAGDARGRRQAIIPSRERKWKSGKAVRPHALAPPARPHRSYRPGRTGTQPTPTRAYERKAGVIHGAILLAQAMRCAPSEQISPYDKPRAAEPIIATAVGIAVRLFVGTRSFGALTFFSPGRATIRHELAS